MQLPKIKSGESIYSILNKYGFDSSQRTDALGHGILPKGYILSPGDYYRVTREPSGRTEVQFFSKHGPEYYSFWRTRDGSAGAVTGQLKLTPKTVVANGKVRGSLIASITKLVREELLAYRFMDAFLLDYNLVKDVRRNANFKITYEKLYEGENFIRYGEVLRAELEIGDQLVVRHFRKLKSGGGIFFDPETSLSNRRLYSPVDDIRISSQYQRRRFHPIKKYRKAHLGVDFELPEGAPVYAAGAGKVLRIGKNRAAGRYIVLRHGDGTESYYNHMSATRPLKPGQYVQAGAQIGAIGCTGYCTKPHLHFAIKKNRQFINPVYLIRNYSFKQRQDVITLTAKSGPDSRDQSL